MWNPNSYRTETSVLKEIGPWNYHVPQVVEEFEELTGYIMTEVKWDIHRALNPSQANRLWNSLRSLHMEGSNVRNFEWKSSLPELYEIFKRNILTEAVEKRFLSDLQISICLKAIDIFDQFIDRYYDGLEKVFLHWDLNDGNILYWEEVWFLDFEKARLWSVMEDIARLYSRVLNNNNELLELFLKAYFQWTDDIRDYLFQVKNFELFHCLWDISYFLYRWHSNGYKFHIKALNDLERILQTLKLW